MARYLSLIALTLFTILNCNPTDTGESVAPQITTQPADVDILAGEPAQFSVAATGTDLSYQWYYNDSLMAGKTTAACVLDCVDVFENGDSLSVSVFNHLDTTVSSAARLIVGTIRVLSPNGGEQYSVGDTLKIRWTASPLRINNVTVNLSLDDGASWFTLSTNSILMSDPDFGTFSWVILDSLRDGFNMVPVASTQCRAVVQEYNLEQFLDLSDQPFTIQ